MTGRSSFCPVTGWPGPGKYLHLRMRRTHGTGHTMPPVDNSVTK